MYISKPFVLPLALCLTALTPALAADSDAAAKQRIEQSVPAMLVPAGSIVRIDLQLKEGNDPKQHRSITDRQTIALLCASLGAAITQGQFEIGHQVHQTQQVLEITFIRRDKPPLRLLSVGASMFWMSWTDKTDKTQDWINFQSQQFAAGFFSTAFLDLWRSAR